jgi:TetR/AcrR family transcriptional repressor of nem operon
MGRVSHSQSLENRARIVEVASVLFRTHGIDTVTISDVMKAAGMTQGGFYTHFETKEHLVAEAWTFSFTSAVNAWKRIAANSVSEGHDALAELVRYYVAPKAPAQTCPMVLFALDAGCREGDHPMRQAYERGVQSLFDAFAEVAASGQREAARDQMCLIFAAMVGANALALGLNQGPWIDDLKKAVRSAAETR